MEGGNDGANIGNGGDIDGGRGNDGGADIDEATKKPPMVKWRKEWNFHLLDNDEIIWNNTYDIRPTLWHLIVCLQKWTGFCFHLRSIPFFLSINDLLTNMYFLKFINIQLRITNILLIISKI